MALTVSFVVACGGASDKGAASSADGPPAVMDQHMPLDTATLLVFEPRTQGTRPFPFAIVNGAIGGKPTKLLVDTGASVHAIDATLAREAGLVIEAAPAVGTQPDGKSVSMQRTKDPKLTLVGWGDTPARSTAILDLPPALRERGIGGLVSPQQLVTAEKAVVIDFDGGWMKARVTSTAWLVVKSNGQVMGEPTRACAVSAGGLDGLALTVDGVVAGEATRLELDSGASRTMLVSRSKAGAQAARRPQVGTSAAMGAGAVVPMSLHASVPVASGAWSETLEMGVIEGEKNADCGYEGRIGIDVLRRCTVVISTEDVRVVCRPAG